MGMNFSPMYQPVSTKTIKADGDLDVNPYDLLATDIKCDTVTVDYTSLLNSTPNSIKVSRQGLSFVHNNYLNGSNYSVTLPYSKPVYAGLVLLGTEYPTFDTVSITANISNPSSLRYGGKVGFYLNNVQIGELNIPTNGSSASGTFTLPYQENITLRYGLTGGEALNNPTITFGNMDYYIIPYGQ